MILGEGEETLDEQALRERKSSLLQLFDSVNLKPNRSNSLARKFDTETDFVEQFSQPPPKAKSAAKKEVEPKTKTKTKEVIGEGEEAEEVELEGEELSENQLDLIYKRYGIIVSLYSPMTVSSSARQGSTL